MGGTGAPAGPLQKNAHSSPLHKCRQAKNHCWVPPAEPAPAPASWSTWGLAFRPIRGPRGALHSRQFVEHVGPCIPASSWSTWGLPSWPPSGARGGFAANRFVEHAGVCWGLCLQQTGACLFTSFVALSDLRLRWSRLRSPFRRQSAQTQMRQERIELPTLGL